MSFRDALADLIGAEVQSHDITLNGKTKTFYFRQISDEEGRAIFAPKEGESDAELGARCTLELIAASACDADGNPVTTLAEVSKLKGYVKRALADAAAKTNNLREPEKPAEQDEAGAEGEHPKA